MRKQKKNKRGIDILSGRFSEFEKKALIELFALSKGDLIVEFGSGKGNFSMIAALMNKKIHSFDLNFLDNYWKLILFKKLFNLRKWEITKKDLARTGFKDLEGDISLVISFRFLHYLKYEEADNLLKILNKKMKKNSLGFFSISGIKTDLAEGYEGWEVELDKRFFKIKKDLRERFQIYEKVCLYKKEEIESLFGKYFEILFLEETLFGNINIIFKKK